MSNTDINNVFKPLGEKTFRFKCHKNIPCFNKCCAKLNLTLTPYDILRMKSRLGIMSDTFLEKYTYTEMEKQKRFPTIKLQMKDDEGKTCPFVSQTGCTIYEDRPGACRMYPIGRASAIVEGKKNAVEKYFIVNEAHCLGFQEEKSWSLEQWIKHEGLGKYYEMNDLWLEIVSSPRSLGEGDTTKKIQMFFMVSYNIDVFRKFIFESGFFQRFEVDPEIKEKITSDDRELMKFGFLWLKFSLFGEKTIDLKI
jgi:Fe-S-cluster containining protein